MLVGAGCDAATHPEGGQPPGGLLAFAALAGCWPAQARAQPRASSRLPWLSAIGPLGWPPSAAGSGNCGFEAGMAR